MKKSVIFFLAFLLVMTGVPLQASAADTVNIDGVIYSSDRTILIECTERYTENTLSIPDGVTEIGDGAFMGNTTIHTIVFPVSLQKIGNDAFRDSALTSADLSGCRQLTIICNSAFAGCTQLTEVNLPESAQTIEESVFRGCSALRSVKLPDTVIPDSCFIDCRNLQSFAVILPESTEKIYRPGKVTPNEEGDVSAADARMILRLAAGLDLTLQHTIFGADVNRDGKITAVDARTVLRVAAHLDTL